MVKVSVKLCFLFQFAVIFVSHWIRIGLMFSSMLPVLGSLVVCYFCIWIRLSIYWVLMIECMLLKIVYKLKGECLIATLVILGRCRLYLPILVYGLSLLFLLLMMLLWTGFKNLLSRLHILRIIRETTRLYCCFMSA